MDQKERGEDRLGAPSGLGWLASSTLLVLALLAVVAIVQVRDAHAEAATAEADAQNAASAAAVAVRAADVVDAVERLAETVVTDGPSALVGETSGLTDVVYVPAEPGRARVRSLLSDGIDLVALQPALARARDSADGAIVAAPFGAPPRSAVVVPVFAGPGDAPTLRPSDPATATRRAELLGYVIGVVDLAALAAGIADGPWVLRDGPVVLLRSDDVDPASAAPEGETVTIAIDVRERRWQLERGVGSATSRAIAFLVALAVAGAVLVVVLSRRVGQRLRQRRDEARQARSRAATIATLSGVTRSSNDLGDILPGLAVQLADTLGLDGMSLSAPALDGRLRQVFAHGDRPDEANAVRLAEVDVVPAGQTVAVPLHRAGRSIAVLHVVVGRALTADEIDLLEVAAEMVTAAVITARSIDQQQDAVARLQAVDELKTAFLGTASHELRTPVTAISGFAHVLVERWESLGETERRVFAERIASNARALEALVQDLLDFARLERGDHAIALEPLDLDEVVQGVLDRLEPVWRQHEIRADLEPTAGVLGDRAALERVVTNLVSNAAKFSPPGSAVDVTVRPAGEHVELCVDDCGPGVPPAERDKIFERFFRGSSQAVVRTRGVGIGLSVVKDFVERMRGDIAVSESPAGGARFTVSFPLVGSAAAGAERLEEDHDVPTA